MSQEIIDFGYDHYVKELQDDFSYVDIGVTAKDGAQKTEGDLTLAELATIQEFGTQISVTKKMRGFLGANGLHLKSDTKEITIPSRPFVRGTFDENESSIANELAEQEKNILAGRVTKKQALTKVGQMHQNQIQDAMGTKGKFKENHPFTKEKKGSDQPLIDTGRLRQSINFEVG